jgi:epsilon-lactone hydrolase
MSTAIRDGLRKTLSEQIAPAFSGGLPLEQQRQALENLGASAELPEGLQIERRELAGLRTEWLTGPGCSTSHALLHLHGGGYVMGSCVTHRALSGRAGLSCGMQAVLPEYRLAPEHPFPAALDDAVAAYKGLLALGFEPGRIVLFGDSAGGGLALATLLVLRDAGLPLPAAAVLLSPWTDMTISGESLKTRATVDPWLKPEMLEPFSKLYVGEHDRKDPRVSPLFGDFRGLPPLLVQVGDQEILLSDSTRLAERARSAGVEIELKVWDELWHVWHLFAPVLPEANAALDSIGAFVRGKLAAR